MFERPMKQGFAFQDHPIFAITDVEEKLVFFRRSPKATGLCLGVAEDEFVVENAPFETLAEVFDEREAMMGRENSD